VEEPLAPRVGCYWRSNLACSQALYFRFPPKHAPAESVEETMISNLFLSVMYLFYSDLVLSDLSFEFSLTS
jgi:hypothetical protein